MKPDESNTETKSLPADARRSYQNSLTAPVFIAAALPAAVVLSAAQGALMGLLIALESLLTLAVLWLLQRLAPSPSRYSLWVQALLAAGFSATLVELLLRAYIPAAAADFGLYIPLSAAAVVLLLNPQLSAPPAEQSHPSAAFTWKLWLKRLLFMWVLLFVLGLIREALGAGTLLGKAFSDTQARPLLLLLLPSGAFILLGLLAALSQYIRPEKETQHD
ncbi:hypothetical protein HCH52_01885 [Oscillospiraceae bacterium HV4-5-C5C]|nr:hypothetical protein [Oscillospiraceae bacterium HV4-5-C5C]